MRSATEVPALDDAPPDWQSYAAVASEYAAECNRFSPPARKQQTAPAHPDLITTEEEAELLEWLRKE